MSLNYSSSHPWLQTSNIRNLMWFNPVMTLHLGIRHNDNATGAVVRVLYRASVSKHRTSISRCRRSPPDRLKIRLVLKARTRDEIPPPVNDIASRINTAICAKPLVCGLQQPSWFRLESISWGSSCKARIGSLMVAFPIAAFRCRFGLVP